MRVDRAGLNCDSLQAYDPCNSTPVNNLMSSSKILPSVQDFLSRPGKMLIGDQWREAAGGKMIDSYYPATNEVIGRFPDGGSPDADAAVAAARRAFNGPWRKMSPYERARLLQTAAALMEKNGDQLAQLIPLENGKPLWEAKK